MNAKNQSQPAEESIRSASVVLPCAELQPTLDFFIQRLGFRLERISPADNPRTAELSGHGLCIVLQRGAGGSPGILRLSCQGPEDGTREIQAPNGTRIQFHPATPALNIPPGQSELVVARAKGDATWITGRAGMRYRDLIPGRLGGRFIASHIRIPGGGPVPDNVHFHAIRFQMIFCAKGWVRVVYEDQGPPIVLRAGDCFLQPPLIRHRVLESSPGLEVIEIACPAEHDTFLDHDLELPNAKVDVERDFGGQRFVYHEQSSATWRPWSSPGFESRDLGLRAATQGLADARVVRALDPVAEATAWDTDREFLFVYVLAGEMEIEGIQAETLQLATGDSVVLPPGAPCKLTAHANGLQFLKVALIGVDED